MSYTPTNWTTGDTITASSLNKIEQGIANAGSALICNLEYNDDLGEHTLDKTAGEIYNALIGGTPVYVKYQYGTLSGSYVSNMYLAPVTYIYGYNYTQVIRIMVSRPSNEFQKNSKDYLRTPSVAIFSASSLNDLPVFYANVATVSTYVDVDASLV